MKILKAVSHRSMESIFSRFGCDIDTGMVKLEPPAVSSDIRRWSSWPSTFSGSNEFKSMYSPFFIAVMTFEDRWLESELTGGTISGVGSCGGGVGCGELEGRESRGRASWMDDAIKDFRVFNCSGVKLPGGDGSVESLFGLAWFVKCTLLCRGDLWICGSAG